MNEFLSGPKPEYLDEESEIQKFRDEFEKKFGASRPAGMPELGITLVLAPHASKVDLVKLPKHLKEAHILLPEGTHWNKEMEFLTQAVAVGVYTPEKANAHVIGGEEHKAYQLELFKKIHGSNVITGYADLPAGHPLARELDFFKSYEKLPRMNFQEAIVFETSYVIQYGNYISQRDHYIFSHFLEKIQELIEKWPHLGSLKKINIVMTMGTMHTELYQLLKRAGAPVKREFNELPESFNYYEEAMRRAQFHKDIDPELIERVLIEEILTHFFSDTYATINPYAKEASSAIRTLVTRIRREDISVIWEQSRNYHIGTLSRKKFTAFLYEKLAQSGIFLPRAKKDFLPYLQKIASDAKN